MKLPVGTFVVAIAFVAACTSAQTAPSAARSELAPTGKLRVGLILSNQVLVTKDPQTGELRGVSVTLGKALAKRLGVPFEPVAYLNPALLVQSFGKNEWDIAFLAFDPARARDVEFSPAYMMVDNSYLVPSGSKVTSVEEADRPGVKIAVPEHSAPDLFLSRNLKAAEIVRVPGGPDAAIDVLRSGRGDAYAENAHMLSLYADRFPGSRVLPGRYTVSQHAVATPKGKSAAEAFNDAAVLDRETGLVWERSPDTGKRDWLGAHRFCIDRAVGNRNRKGWRLPTVQEILSLVDLTRESPFLPTGHPFTNVQADFYWSATTFGENPALAWGGGFENNLTEPGARFTDKTFQFYVWCVRSGLAGPDVQ
jgi:polar amino acid transport system substrate-binding protein